MTQRSQMQDDKDLNRYLVYRTQTMSEIAKSGSGKTP
jgi:hypothetical protein